MIDKWQFLTELSVLLSKYRLTFIYVMNENTLKIEIDFRD